MKRILAVIMILVAFNANAVDLSDAGEATKDVVEKSKVIGKKVIKKTKEIGKKIYEEGKEGVETFKKGYNKKNDQKQENIKPNL